jgi:hypothetical protein
MKSVTLFFSVFFLALLIVNFGAIYSYSSLEESLLKKEVLEHLETTVESRVDHINEFLEQQKNNIKMAATHKELSNEKLRAIKDSSETFSEAFIIDSSGKIIASSDLSMIGKDKSDNIYFIEGKKGIYIKDVHYSTERNEPSMDVAIPQGEGNVLVARIDVNVLSKIVLDRIGLGETGETYLINKESYMATSSRFFSKKETFLKKKIDTINSRHCLEGLNQLELHEEGKHIGHEAIELYLDYRGEKVFGAHAYVPEMKWCLLAKIDKNEIFNKIIVNNYAELLITSLVISLSVIIVGALFWIFVLGRKKKERKRKRKIIVWLFGIVLILNVLGFALYLGTDMILEPLNRDLPRGIEKVTTDSHLNGLAQFIRYYDEVLTQSARNYAFTSDVKWKERYVLVVPKLDDTIKEAIEKGDEQDSKFFLNVNKANLALVEMEEQAINLIDNKKSNEAISILESDEYWKQKEIYEEGLKDYVARKGMSYDETLLSSVGEIESASKQAKNSVMIIKRVVMIFIFIGIVISFLLSISILKSILHKRPK